MQKLKILNSKEIKKMFKVIESQFGVRRIPDYVYLRNPEGKIYVINRKFGDLDLSKLRINSLGMYFCKVESNGEIRLTIEGCQILKPLKNVLEVNEDKSFEWLRGKGLEYVKTVDLGMEKRKSLEEKNLGARAELKGFVVLKFGKDYLGCGKIKEGRVLNFVSKNRWIK